MHKFEAAGLGKAPYRLVGNYLSYYQAIPGDPNCPMQPGTSCDYCSMAIADVYRVESADGREFKLGCDCVNKIGDKGLMRQVNRIKRQRQVEREKARLEAFIEAFPGLEEPLSHLPAFDGYSPRDNYSAFEWNGLHGCSRMPDIRGGCAP